jgi:mRNA interferase MazF
MSRILRGEIYWADLNPTIGNEQAGFRSIFIISNTIFNQRSGTVIALAITCQPQKAGFPLRYELLNTELPNKSWVKISQIRTLSILRIKDKAGKIEPEELNQITDGLNEIISE